MKICWDNLEILQFNKKTGTWKKNTNIYYEKICCNCGEYFLGLKKSKFCSLSCSNSDEFNNMFMSERFKELNPFFNKKHTIKSKKNISEKNKISLLKNKHAFKCGSDFVWYDTHVNKIEWCEEVRRAPDNENILEVRCKYCGKWFKPNIYQVSQRFACIMKNRSGDSNFYCSKECKNKCPIYHKSINNSLNLNNNINMTIFPELKKLVFERDNYTCQKCGYKSSNKTGKGLHCHHINPVKLDPLESADMDNCITLCKDCHKEAHQKDGCKTWQLAYCINI